MHLIVFAHRVRVGGFFVCVWRNIETAPAKYPSQLNGALKRLRCWTRSLCDCRVSASSHRCLASASIPRFRLTLTNLIIAISGAHFNLRDSFAAGNLDKVNFCVYFCLRLQQRKHINYRRIWQRTHSSLGMIVADAFVSHTKADRITSSRAQSLNRVVRTAILPLKIKNERNFSINDIFRFK